MEQAEGSDALRTRLSRIRVVLLDVDGVLTDGRIWWVGGDVGWTRAFSVHDGFGIKRCLRQGLEVAVVSADDNAAMRERVKMLGIQRAWFGAEDKLGAYEAIKASTGAHDYEILFAGDELYDIPLIERAGIGVSVPDACPEARQAADYVTTRRGGHGAVREVLDMVLAARGAAP